MCNSELHPVELHTAFHSPEVILNFPKSADACMVPSSSQSCVYLKDMEEWPGELCTMTAGWGMEHRDLCHVHQRAVNGGLSCKFRKSWNTNLLMFFNHWKCKIYTNVQILQNRFLGQIELTGYILPTTVLRRQTFLEKWRGNGLKLPMRIMWEGRGNPPCHMRGLRGSYSWGYKSKRGYDVAQALGLIPGIT